MASRVATLITFVVISLLTGGSLQAKVYIPDLLEPWQAWVLHDHKTIDCPHAHSTQQSRYCRWPTSLSLNIQQDQARFEQVWRIYNEGWLTLPGDHQYWPTNVLVDGQSVAVVNRGKKPSIFVPAGEYQVSGELHWLQRPESIAVPLHTGLISLVVDGKPITSVNRDKQGRLWFAKAKQQNIAVNQHNSVTTRVYRKVSDGVPLRLETRLEMEIAGANRELQLGRFQLAGFETIRFDSDLPARIEDDGRLRVQVRPGRWVFTLISRKHQVPSLNTSNTSNPVTAMTMQQLGEHWPDQEVWVFQADRKFRSVKITGVPTVDPEQTGLPQEWKQLPAYILSDNQTLKINQQIRGDVSPDENRLSLQRNLWLDFAGKGYTIKDEISGNINRIGRLSTDTAFSLGRVSVNGNPYVVTKMQDGREGVEVRPGEIALDAVGRLDRNGESLSAIGWSEPMESLFIDLHLPPGWTLFAATGVDSVHNSWLSSWSLWHVFVFLIITVSVFRLFGVQWALVVGLALLSVHNIKGVPWTVIWLVLLALYGVLKVVPEGRWRQLTFFAYRATLLGLTLSLIPFAVNQVRQGIYPQLEHPYKRVATEQADAFATRQHQQEANLPVEMDAMEDSYSLSSAMPRSEPKIARLKSSSLSYQRYDVNTKIQTGPGVPQWKWNRSRLQWSGPVTPTQSLELWFIPPTMNALLSFLRVLLMGLLLWLFIKPLASIGMGQGKSSGGSGSGSGTSHSVVATGFALILFAAVPWLTPNSAVADIPTKDMLETLEKRLLAPVACLPRCAAISQGRIVVEQGVIAVSLTMDASESVVVPLPVDKATWKPSEILLNGKPSSTVSIRGGKYLVLLDKGQNKILIKGKLHDAEQLNFSFKLNPHNITVHAPGWQMIGYVKGQVKGKNLQLKRKAIATKEEKREQLLAEPATAFVEVQRTLYLGIEWRVSTQVRRIAPVKGPISLAVPLLKGESLTTDLPVENGRVVMSMAANQQTLSWDAIVKPQDTFVLTASEGSWVERWHVIPSQRWHVEHTGILPIKQEGVNRISWWPMVGETVELSISKPAAVEGSTLTLQSVNLLYEPGARATKSTLSLNMRSSFAGEYVLRLPAQANVESVTVDGESQVRADDSGNVVIPVKPGQHIAEVRWLNEDGARLKIVTPSLDLMQEASNVGIRVAMPRDRWTLFVGGPAMGPALLFWGVALVIIAISLVLGRSQWSFLKPYEWMLLGLGIATTFIPLLLLIAGWFFAMFWRQRWAEGGTQLSHKKQLAIQWALGLLTLAMLVSLLASVASSLVFGSPDMQITGNGSNAYWLNWYQDRTDGLIPSGWVISLPMGAYRLAMLAWSLWLAFALIRWLRWGWQCFTTPVASDA